MVDSQHGAKCGVGYNYMYLIVNKRKWNNNYCLVKNTQRISLFELPGYSNTYHSCGPWYMSSDTMLCKPIKT